MISQHLRTIFTSVEFPKEAIGVQEQYLEGYEPKKDAVVRRLRFNAFISRRPLPPGLEHEFLACVNSHRAAQKDNIAESFDLSPFLSYYDAMDLVLDAIMVMPEVHRLIVPASIPGRPLWPKLSKFFAVNETISIVETKEPPDKSFRDFVRDLSGKRSSGIHELKFSDAEYDAEFMVQLAILFESREISLLSITNGATETGILTLAALLPSCVGFQNLRELTLVGCPALEARAFLQPLPKLRTFTADDRTLDAGRFLSQFCCCENSELEELTLLRGAVLSPLPQNGSFPDHLTRLVLPDVPWSGNNLSLLFAILARRTGERPIFINIARAKMADEQWLEFDVFLQDFTFAGLQGLVFDNNRVGCGLPHLLSQSTDLQTLSINGCIVEPSAHSLIARAIATSRTLHQLTIEGGKEQAYRNFIEVYAEAILENKSLRCLSIAGNRIGDRVVEFLKEVFERHPRLREVLFDKNGVTDLENMRSLYDLAGQVDRRVFLRFPNDDVDKLKCAGQIAEHDVHKLRLQCADALRRRAKFARVADDEDLSDGGTRETALKTGEFLEILVPTHRGAGEGVLPSELQDMVDEQNMEYIGDGKWAAETDPGDSWDNDRELPPLVARSGFLALLDDIKGGARL
jgi:hypothetical protein